MKNEINYDSYLKVMRMMLGLCFAILITSIYFGATYTPSIVSSYSTDSSTAAENNSYSSTNSMTYVSSTQDTSSAPDSSSKQETSSAPYTSSTAYTSNTPQSSNSSVKFTNKYGTPTTKCAHSGCNNYIASSGDTNCCTTHSNRCLNCNKYIDEDAMYCMDCLKAASTSSSSSSGSSYYGSSSSSSSSSFHECYVCGKSASEKVGSYWYCSKHAAWVRAASGY